MQSAGGNCKIVARLSNLSDERKALKAEGNEITVQSSHSSEKFAFDKVFDTASR